MKVWPKKLRGGDAMQKANVSCPFTLVQTHLQSKDVKFSCYSVKVPWTLLDSIFFSPTACPTGNYEALMAFGELTSVKVLYECQKDLSAFWENSLCLNMAGSRNSYWGQHDLNRYTNTAWIQEQNVNKWSNYYFYWSFSSVLHLSLNL